MLHDVSDATAMEIVIIRPPLVYGPMVKANFQTLLKAVYSGMPLPFYGVQNRRSMIYLGNLVDALVLCLWHEHAANQTFLVSDDNDVSISELIINIAQQMRKKPRLFHFPLSLLKTIALVMGKKEAFDRLSLSLQIDCSLIKNLLQWNPHIHYKKVLKKPFGGFFCLSKSGHEVKKIIRPYYRITSIRYFSHSYGLNSVAYSSDISWTGALLVRSSWNK